MLSLLLVTALVILLLFLFRRPIATMFRYWLTRAAHPRQKYAGKGYVDLVEALDANDVAENLSPRGKKAETTAGLLRDYRGLTRPEERVRRGLYLLRWLYSQREVTFPAGDTPREMLARMDADPAALRSFGAAYERVRYAGEAPTQDEAEQAAALVYRTAETQPKAVRRR